MKWNFLSVQGQNEENDSFMSVIDTLISVSRSKEYDLDSI